MSFFGRLFRNALGRGGGPSRTDDAGANAFWLYVRCAHCREKIRVRVSREHDLSAEFEGSDFPSAFYAHKDIVGSRCFRRIQVDLQFDGRRQLVEQTVSGGEAISREEYEAEDGDGAGAESGGAHAPRT